MPIDKEIYYEKLRKVNVQAELKALIESARDDVLVVLRIHLMCENILEAWICSSVGVGDFFTKPVPLKLNFSSKLGIARNLNFPKPVYEFFKQLNYVRNEFSHNFGTRDIALGLATKLKALSAQMPFGGLATIIIDNDRSAKYELSSADTPERIKLCMLFLLFQMQISMEVEPKIDSKDNLDTRSVTIQMPL